MTRWLESALLKNTSMTTITSRIHVNPQSKGNLGKSLETEMRVAWLMSYGISWDGSDMDDRHSTFSARHPEQTTRFKIGNAAEAKSVFLTLFRRVLRAPVAVHVIDMRAQSDDLFVSALEELTFLDLCAEHDARMTFFLFHTDDAESMLNFAQLVQFGGDKVDFVVVHNPPKSQGSLYRGSRLEKTLANAGAKTITLPTITPVTMMAMERAESRAGRGISFAEFASPETEHLERIMKGEIQWALTRMNQQYDAIAELLVPTKFAAKIRAEANEDRTTKKPHGKNQDFGLNFGE